MSRIDLVALAQQRVRAVVEEGDTVIDATLGNGHDALLLAQLIGDSATSTASTSSPPPSSLHASALHNTISCRAPRCLSGHQTMAEVIPEKVRGTIKTVMFNLGYLPGNDHTVRTRSSTTLQALESARTHLAPDGIIVSYTGHAHGREETEAVKAWARGLESAGY